MAVTAWDWLIQLPPMVAVVNAISSARAPAKGELSLSEPLRERWL